MTEVLAPFVEFAFMRRALVGCIALSLAAPPIGVFLTLRHMSLMSDAMSHAILPGAALGFVAGGLSLPAMAFGGLLAGLTVALLSGLVARSTILREDSSLAAFYLVSLALGVLIVSIRGSSLDLLHILFGTVLALDDASVILLGVISAVTLVWLAVFFRALVAESVDPLFHRLAGRTSAVTHLSFLGIVVLNLVGGFQALGTLLSVGLMLLPAVTARFWARTLLGLLPVSVATALLASFGGLLLSYRYNLPSGPAIVLLAGGMYVVSMLIGPAGGLLTGRLRGPGAA